MKNKLNDEAVSPVIGVILMVAVTVVMASVVWVLIGDLGDQEGASPTLYLREDGLNRLEVFAVSDPVTWEELTVTGCSDVPEGQVLAGQVLKGCSGEIRVIHDETQRVIYANEL